eukprot:CAMPEP_0194553464 /NCGR_PEP_ID=MMETSP0253-20130528/97243_1 /TAXON_ID=2966 /ORGANISM="Noctiluca scintillans" /LENGTH=116 /DNA_ID=CAMNT_0039400943 /DNA_START=767 /DNA_END=1117 /DNA_ORIENTATION=-
MIEAPRKLEDGDQSERQGRHQQERECTVHPSRPPHPEGLEDETHSDVHLNPEAEMPPESDARFVPLAHNLQRFDREMTQIQLSQSLWHREQHKAQIRNRQVAQLSREEPVAKRSGL